MIPVQYRAVAWLLLVLGLIGGGFYAGHDWATTKAEARRVKLVEQQLADLAVAKQRADGLERKLASAEGRIVTRTVEVIKHVPQVTTGRLCLDAPAVGLLQPGAAWGPYQASGRPAAESPPAASSDTDVAYWIAEANQRYETCAARLNLLVDYHKKPD